MTTEVQAGGSQESGSQTGQLRTRYPKDPPAAITYYFPLPKVSRVFHNNDSSWRLHSQHRTLYGVGHLVSRL